MVSKSQVWWEEREMAGVRSVEGREAGSLRISSSTDKAWSPKWTQLCVVFRAQGSESLGGISYCPRLTLVISGLGCFLQV